MGLATLFSLSGCLFASAALLPTWSVPPFNKSDPLAGLPPLPGATLSVPFYGTKRDGEKLIANGGRVLNITGMGSTVREARDRAYAGLDLIDWPEGFCRRDIGWRAL